MFNIRSILVGSAILVLLSGCGGTSKEDILLHDGFELLIPEESEAKLNEWKEIALEQGIISDDLKEYVSAQWVHKGDTADVEIRLKGDWTDHLENDLPSYRIKLPNGFSFRGIETFSIQDPMTRNYAHEWFMHQLFEGENMLVTSYHFVPGLINGEGGTFALEEHFESRLLTSRGRAKGPILKIDEGGLWEARLLGDEVEHDYPIFPAAAIKPFKKSKIAGDKGARKEFEVASNLVSIYKTNQFNASDLFDMNQSGKYFALLELGYVTHSHIWHNQRFYYNPVSTKMEFIGFDMNPGHESEEDTMIFIRQELNQPLRPTGYNLVWPFLCDAEFRASYTSNLKRFSAQAYLDSVESALEKSIESVESLLEENEMMYDFDLDFYAERASIIRDNLKNLDADWDRFWGSVDRSKLSYNKKYFPLGDSPVLESAGLNIYQEEKKENIKLEFENYHRSGVEVIGFSSPLNPETYIPLKEPIKLPAFEMFPERVSAKVEVKVGMVYFKMEELEDTVFRAEAMPWRAPEQEHPRFKLAKKFKKDSELYEVKGNQLIFRSGKLKIDELIYVPDSLEVMIPAGADLEFQEKAGLIVNGPFKVIGSKEAPVKMDFDKEGYGVLVLNSSVEMNFVEMSGSGGLEYKGWRTKAALTIYGSKVSIGDCEFRKSNASCAVQMTDCIGKIESTVIRNTRKDGLSVYGSELEFNKVELSGIDGAALEVCGSMLTMNSCKVEDVEEIMEATAHSGIISKGLIRGEKVGRCRLLDGSTYTTESGFYPSAK